METECTPSTATEVESGGGEDPELGSGSDKGVLEEEEEPGPGSGEEDTDGGVEDGEKTGEVGRVVENEVLKAGGKKEEEMEDGEEVKIEEVVGAVEDVEKEEESQAEEKPRTTRRPGGAETKDGRKMGGKRTENQPAESALENGKKKGREEKPPSKVVVRRLPPSMTLKTFLEQVSPLPPVDYSYFVSANPSVGVHSFSRAYLNFINQDDLFAFTRTFDNYVFLDAKGQEYPAVVEFAPFQRVPKARQTKKRGDPLSGTIESDAAYVAFKETHLAEALENSKPGANTVKQHYFETENVSTTEEVSTTPLLEHLKVKRAEKARQKEERREEKRRKEAERKLKQKAKEKKQESGGGEEESKEMGEVKIPSNLPLKNDPPKGEEIANPSEPMEESRVEERAKAQSNCLKRMLGLLPTKEDEEQKPSSRITILKKEAPDCNEVVVENHVPSSSSSSLVLNSCGDSNAKDLGSSNKFRPVKFSHRYSAQTGKKKDLRPHRDPGKPSSALKVKKKEHSLSECQLPNKEGCGKSAALLPLGSDTCHVTKHSSLERVEPMRPTFVIDKALNTDNILPRAFSNIKSSRSQGNLPAPTNPSPNPVPSSGLKESKAERLSDVGRAIVRTRVYRRAGKV